MEGGIPMINSCKQQYWKNIKQKLQHVTRMVKTCLENYLMDFD
jgi:hypothetical protein